MAKKIKSARGSAADMVAVLRARGFTADQIARGFDLPKKQVIARSEVGSHISRRNCRWTLDRITQEVIIFFEREKRWPQVTDFRSERSRAMGLPSYHTLNAVVLERNSWAWWERGRAHRERIRSRLNQLRLGDMFPNSESPQGPYPVLQAWIIVNRDLTPAQIMGIPNALLRRRAIERVGWEKLTSAPNVEKISEDKFGTLFSMPGETSRERMVMVEVVNSTPEPDGTFAKYYLRVDPRMKTPQQAIAWSFGVTEGWETFEFLQQT